ncbi:MAG: PqqD family protein [Ruminococcus sp.]|nr:PqqD family protein [Ruminococcus sp.]
MKIKSGFVLKEIAGSHLVVPLGSQVVDFGAIIKLSETGAFLWSMLEQESSYEQLVCALTSEYDVDKAKAQKDVDSFINKLKEADLLE